jgi:molybdopterin converting factor subunit 1
MSDTDRISVTLRFFGALSESVSGEPVARSLADGTTLAELRRALIDEHPKAEHLARCMIAVNAEYRDDEATLRAGDEVALIPPVSGG